MISLCRRSFFNTHIFLFWTIIFRRQQIVWILMARQEERRVVFFALLMKISSLLWKSLTSCFEDRKWSINYFRSRFTSKMRSNYLKCLAIVSISHDHVKVARRDWCNFHFTKLTQILVWFLLLLLEWWWWWCWR